MILVSLAPGLITDDVITSPNTEHRSWSGCRGQRLLSIHTCESTGCPSLIRAGAGVCIPLLAGMVLGWYVSGPVDIQVLCHPRDLPIWPFLPPLPFTPLTVQLNWSILSAPFLCLSEFAHLLGLSTLRTSSNATSSKKTPPSPSGKWAPLLPSPSLRSFPAFLLQMVSAFITVTVLVPLSFVTVRPQRKVHQTLA